MTQNVENRRNFIRQSLTLAFSLSAIPVIGSSSTGFKQIESNPALPYDLVHEFVGASHGNLPRVKEMLVKEPMLVNACWDWGGGDFELAIGGAAHMGNTDIANYLLDNNARIDIFSAAMLGHKAMVTSSIESLPNIVNVRGPHKYPLLYHVAISGDIALAQHIKPHLKTETLNGDFNRSLHAAARHGRLEMLDWLLKNGVSNPNTKDVLGRTPLRSAEEKGFKEAVLMLKKYGAK